MYSTRTETDGCGLAGTWGIGPDGLVQDVMELRRHRGPDGERVCQDSTRGLLGHVRLAIINPEQGGQPIRNEDASPRNWPRWVWGLESPPNRQAGKPTRQPRALAGSNQEPPQNQPRGTTVQTRVALIESERLVVVSARADLEPLVELALEQMKSELAAHRPAR